MSDSLALANGQTLTERYPSGPLATLANLWTNAVAYVALLAGAGLSMAGNVADVLRTRGQATDGMDVAIAVAMPGLVVLAVHMFVSPRWDGLDWPMQAMRWTGCLAIGGMAMVVSWFHLHDLLLARQQPLVATILEPLALDAMAIMATALLLAGRRLAGQAGALASGQVADMTEMVASLTAERVNEIVANHLATGQATDQDIDVAIDDRPIRSVAWPAVPVSPASWVDREAEAILRLANLPSAEDLANRPDRLAIPNQDRPRPMAIPEGVAEMVARMVEQGAAMKEIDQAVASVYEVAERTARRWRGQLASEPGQ